MLFGKTQMINPIMKHKSQPEPTLRAQGLGESMTYSRQADGIFMPTSLELEKRGLHPW